MPLTSNDIDRITGATVRGADDDKIGTVGQVYVDTDGSPVWIAVKTGFFGTAESFVPLNAADLDGGDVHVPFTKDVVKDAPRVANDGELSENETDGLYDYYSGHGADFGTQATTSERGAGYDQTSAGTPAGYEDADVETPSAGSNRNETDKPHDGHDTSGPSTDDAMTRSEERLHVGTTSRESGRARLRKHIVTEQQTVTVPVTHEEAVLTREPITEANVGDATSGPDLSEEEHEVVLHADEVVTSKDTVAVERVRLGTQQVTEQQQVTEDVRKEQIDQVDADGDVTTLGQ